MWKQLGMALGYLSQRLSFGKLLWWLGLLSLFMGGYFVMDTKDISFRSNLIVFNTCMCLEMVNGRAGFWTNGILIKVVFLLLFVFQMVRAVKLVTVNYQISIKTKEMEMVENAVRHGILKKDAGGTVSIKSSGNDKEYKITVTDDGAGFDMAGWENDGKVHVGLKNVEKRLKLMCKGSLEIGSTLGQGTMVTIRIPKYMKTDEE